MVPRCCTLDGFGELAHSGVSIRDLDTFAELLIQTQNTLYRIIVLDPKASKVLVQGGSYFREPMPGQLAGSSLGGSMLKVAWIGTGMCLELSKGGQSVVTSPVKSVQIRQEPAPGPF